MARRYGVPAVVVKSYWTPFTAMDSMSQPV